MSIVAKVYRGNLIDMTHIGHIAVVDYTGRLMYYCGDPNRITFARSSAKPIQTIPAYECGAVDAYGITDMEAAAFSGSHSGENIHVEAVKSILSKAGLSTDYLQCGIHTPFSRAAAKELKDTGLSPEQVHNNCSGKHASMLITAKYLNEDLCTYYKPEHPVQKRIMKVLSEICNYEEDKIITAVDGCGVPVHAMPLYKFAHGFARLSKPEVFNDIRQGIVKRITDSMTSYPEMIGGTERICTDLMKLCGDRLFAKAGAAAYYAIGLKNKGVGLALKIEDGSLEVMYPVILEILRKLDVLTDSEIEALKSYYLMETKNHRGEVVGFIKTDFKLLKGC